MSESENLAPFVRKATQTDYPEWSQLWAGYHAFYGRSLDTALAPEITSATWARLLDPSEAMIALVAELNGRVVGFAHILFQTSTISIEPVCYLADLFVSSSDRGRRIGAALIAASAAEARARGARKLYWQTQETNSVARRLYDRVAKHRGFIVYDVMLG